MSCRTVSALTYRWTVSSAYRSGQSQVGAESHVLSRGGDALVPAAGRTTGLYPLLLLPGHVGCRLHLRRDDHRSPHLPWRPGDVRPARQDIQSEFSWSDVVCWKISRVGFVAAEVIAVFCVNREFKNAENTHSWLNFTVGLLVHYQLQTIVFQRC